MERGTRYTECQLCKAWNESLVDQYPDACVVCGKDFDGLNKPEIFFVKGEFGDWHSKLFYERQFGQKKKACQSGSINEVVNLGEGFFDGP